MIFFFFVKTKALSCLQLRALLISGTIISVYMIMHICAISSVWLERVTDNDEVPGSSPGSRT